ncbi:MAG: flagellar modification protein B, partial [Candidatus Omnitrophica bacterium]|nr:flagellar modification protein B [Candidatus Omnitrophota bacterium]
HAFLKCEELFGEQYDAVIDLDVTAPIRTVEDIDNAWQIFQEQKALTLFSVVKAHKNPYFNMVEEREDGEVCLSKPLGRINRRQDAPAVYAMNASIYFYSREHICGNEDPAPFSSRTRMYVMDDIAGVDIDREVDFKFIEFLIKEKIVAI